MDAPLFWPVDNDLREIYLVRCQDNPSDLSAGLRAYLDPSTGVEDPRHALLEYHFAEHEPLRMIFPRNCPACGQETVPFTLPPHTGRDWGICIRHTENHGWLCNFCAIAADEAAEELRAEKGRVLVMLGMLSNRVQASAQGRRRQVRRGVVTRHASKTIHGAPEYMLAVPEDVFRLVGKAILDKPLDFKAWKATRLGKHWLAIYECPNFRFPGRVYGGITMDGDWEINLIQTP